MYNGLAYIKLSMNYYTVYDMNMVKQLENDTSLPQEQKYIYCAMQLYLDFINLFIRLLAIFGKRRE